MIALLLLLCGAAPPAPRDASLPDGAFARLGPASKGKGAEIVDSLAYWPDGKVLVSGSYDGVAFWHVPTRKRHRFVPSPASNEAPGFALLDRYGYTALFVPSEETMHAYDLRGARPLPEIKTNNKRLALVLSADGSTVARAEADGTNITVRAWEADTGAEKIRFYLKSESPKKVTLAISPNGKLLAAILEDKDAGVVYSGLVRTTNCREVESLGNASALSMAFSPDGKTLAIVRDGVVNLHSGITGRTRGDVLMKGLRAENVAFSPDGGTLALASPGSGSRQLQMLELASKKLRFERTVPSRFGNSVLAFSPRGGTLATDGNDGRPILWDMAGRYSRSGGITRTTLDQLSSRSAETGQKALAQLMSSPKKAVALLRSQVKPARAPLDEEKIKQLIAMADDRDPVLRDKAQAALVDAGYVALSPLRVARRLTDDKNVQAGLERLIDEANHPIARCTLRDLRAVEALEKLGTPDARRLLRELAVKSFPASALSDAAWAALDRMEKRR